MKPQGRKNVRPPSRKAVCLVSRCGEAVDALRKRLGHGRHQAPERSEEPEHLQAEHDHDRAREQREHAGGGRREHQRRSQRADCAAEQRVGDEPPGIEIEVRLQSLQAGQVRVGRVVFGRDGDQQAAGDGNAARNGRDEPDPERQSQAHRIGHGDPARKQREVLQGQHESSQNSERRTDLEIVARRVGHALGRERPRAIRDR